MADISLIIRDVKLASRLLGSPGKPGHGVVDVTVPGAGKGGAPVTVKWPIVEGAWSQSGPGPSPDKKGDKADDEGGLESA